ncbi:hypothetical protein FRUB_08678 [Fimbriiglobus ruber]|uniref:Uncharacterized protein n=1 Tax=Fimbriiglobus ruber TaxID=1908690 RepID=A0A225DIC1_9BACT|nr:hypothetical protein FRUB_08678 [Fimbriiglobus ruber]
MNADKRGSEKIKLIGSYLSFVSYLRSSAAKNLRNHLRKYNVPGQEVTGNRGASV